MKFLAVVSVVILSLGVNKAVFANEPEAHAAKGGHADLNTEMNSLFPEKQKNSKVSARPPSVELTGPKFLAKVSGEIKLEWKPTLGADSYHVQIATDPNFKWLVVHDQSVKDTAFNFTKGEAGKKYYWRVAAFNSKNDSMYTKSNFTGSVFVTK